MCILMICNVTLVFWPKIFKMLHFNKKTVVFPNFSKSLKAKFVKTHHSMVKPHAHTHTTPTPHPQILAWVGFTLNYTVSLIKFFACETGYQQNHCSCMHTCEMWNHPDHEMWNFIQKTIDFFDRVVAEKKSVQPRIEPTTPTHPTHFPF